MRAKEKSGLLERPWLALSLVLLAGLIFGYLVAGIRFSSREKSLIDQIHPVRANNAAYTFINPLLGYSIPNTQQFNNFQNLQQQLGIFTDAQKQKGAATDISIYFRDMNLGRWTGLDENEKYDPASMLKVAIMFAYYKQAEIDPQILSQSIVYSNALDSQINDIPFQTPSELKVGKSYSVEQLIETMIIDSDNGAKNALLADVSDSALNAVYSDLDIPAPSDNAAYTISPKDFSLFFRILYNASYLDQPLSEKALQLLNRATYKDGLLAGVPGGIKVAQKFGEHINYDDNKNPTTSELHDCGIVYYPAHPYVLCVMTKGTSLDALTSIIKNVSQIVYQNIDSLYKK